MRDGNLVAYLDLAPREDSFRDVALAGLRRARALGCAWVEFDVRLTGETFAEFAVGFNGDYLLDAFSRLTGDVQVRFATTNGQTAVLIYAEPAPGETFEYVVMPMRV